MKKCICELKEKDTFEDNNLGVILGVALLLIIFAVIAIVNIMAFGISLVVFTLLPTVYAFPKIKRHHSKYCSFRYALLEILSLGNVISF